MNKKQFIDYDQQGMTLIELVIAMALGVLLLGGLGKIYLASNQAYSFQKELLGIRENTRIALELITRNIQNSGYTGCPAWTKLANSLNGNTKEAKWMAQFTNKLMGFPSKEYTVDYIDHLALSPALITYTLDSSRSYAVKHYDSMANKVHIADNNHGFNGGDLLALVDNHCRQIFLFIADYVSDDNTVYFNTQVDGLLFNCSALTLGNYHCNSNAKGEGYFSFANAQLIPIDITAFYIRNFENIPSLYATKAGLTREKRWLNAQLLLVGVEEFDWQLGVDFDQDGIQDQYLNSDQIDPLSFNWQSVSTIRYHLVMRGLVELLAQPMPYLFIGKNKLKEDLYIRRTISRTVQLQN